jgi:hypothetical protein
VRGRPESPPPFDGPESEFRFAAIAQPPVKAEGRGRENLKVPLKQKGNPRMKLIFRRARGKVSIRLIIGKVSLGLDIPSTKPS